MSDHVALRRIKLAPRHAATGKTIHRLGSRVLATPVMLEIVRYEGDSGFYLFYYAALAGEETTDTCHDTLEGAMAQAKRESNVEPEDWEELIS